MTILVWPETDPDEARLTGRVIVDMNMQQESGPAVTLTLDTDDSRTLFGHLGDALRRIDAGPPQPGGDDA